ncbi:S41 family peptidase [Fluviicola taffensis]|uniref:Carboxyl-terminal protease n=1 Tax=Fluviicola taffensis (strain DSM 16823 / NCIMB 13979 / RW262) TaxID=755732 RepID=F2IEP9_FLUTR|nr:S41 family peptidase [Fluviicola taffensis]AEA45616.1 carboxyl-terminal protease [Fluviicola taffensis DSM 16823]
MKYYSVILILLVSINSFFASAQKTPTDPRVPTNGQRLDEIFMYINKLYVDPVNDKELMDAAIISMLEKLDPHTVYIPKDEVEAANVAIDGSFVGIGVRFQILKDTLMVVETIAGGPSEKLGIRAGDKIVMIDGQNVAGIGLKNTQVREKLLGEAGTKVRVDILRKAQKKQINYVITRDKVPVNSVDCAYLVTPKIGYLKLTSFSRTSHDEIKKGLEKLKAQGMESLILDLQGNGGGLLYAAQLIADELLSDDKLIVYSEGRSQPRQDLNAGRSGSWEKGKVVILIDDNSASASEILSGAVQDWDRGLIVGRRSYGKGLVQRPIDLSDGSQMRLTIARYFTPSGRFIQRSYENIDDYKNEYMRRFMHGEFSHIDSIKLPDSLKFETRITKRPVYGGGGIMPDFFVPIDTSEITDLYRKVVQNGSYGSFPLSFVDKNRDELNKKYESIDQFITNFKVDKKLMDEFFDFVKKENKDFEFKEDEYKISKEIMELRLKATIANDLFGIEAFYKIYNQKNEILQKAIQLLETKEYDKQKLAMN